MKIKYLILLLLVTLVCGCTKIEDQSIDDVLATFNTKNKAANTYHTGFKYYVPNGCTVSEYMLYNDIIETEDFTFYLYADVISYFNKADLDYEVNDLTYFSKKLDYKNKTGYIEINLADNNHYLIEIMYNYAKIEVMVDSEKDITLALSYAVSILKSIQYNDIVIANLLGEDVLTFQEEEFDMFSTTSSESSYLKRLEEEDLDIKESEKNYKDTDLLN